MIDYSSTYGNTLITCKCSGVNVKCTPNEHEFFVFSSLIDVIHYLNSDYLIC